MSSYWFLYIIWVLIVIFHIKSYDGYILKSIKSLFCKSFLYSKHQKQISSILSSNQEEYFPEKSVLPDTFIKVKKNSIGISNIQSGGTKSRRLRNQGVVRSKELINPNKLRIIGGSAKGKKIESPDVYLRPMMSKVREALFNSLEYLQLFDNQNTRVLDIFAGSGSVGLEALSRGATYAAFVDFSQDCIQTALMNSKNLGFDKISLGVCGRAEDVLRNPAVYSLDQPFQLITLTPPYEEVIYKELLDTLVNSSLVTENTIVVVEYPVEMGTMPYIIDDKLYGIRNRRYGRTILAIYVYRPTKTFNMHPDEFLGTKKR